MFCLTLLPYIHKIQFTELNVDAMRNPRYLKQLSFTSKVDADGKEFPWIQSLPKTSLDTLVQHRWITEYYHNNNRHNVVFSNKDDKKLNDILRLQQDQQRRAEIAAENERRIQRERQKNMHTLIDDAQDSVKQEHKQAEHELYD
eukprot:233940_1